MRVIFDIFFTFLKMKNQGQRFFTGNLPMSKLSEKHFFLIFYPSMFGQKNYFWTVSLFLNHDYFNEKLEMIWLCS